MLGYSCNFTATNQESLSVADSNFVSPTTQATWSYWFKSKSDHDPVIFAKFNTGQQAYWIQQNYSANINFTNSSESPVNYTQTYSTDWHHYVWTYDSGIVKLWIDGVYQSAKSPGGTSLTDTTSSLYLCYVQKYNSAWCDGYLDEVTIWTGTALATSSVEALYNSGTPLPYLYTAPEPTGTTSTSTAIGQDKDTHFLLAVIIFFLSFMTFGLVFSAIRKH